MGVLIEGDGVSKKFCRSLKRSLRYGAADILRDVTGRSLQPGLRTDEFWALEDVSFQVRRGECLGLIGRNGAGKSTLLKILNGLIKPDAGRVVMRGRVGALIELNSGINPILTGRENVYISGALLGFSKKEIDSKLEAIVDFAEIDDFIDMPVQNYSSGMKVRLGFAVAAQMEPDILLLDEVLAVGDVGFRIKCFNAIHHMTTRAATIFVSHSMPQVARVCSDILVMADGRAAYLGNDVPRGIELYYDMFEAARPTVGGSGDVRLFDVLIRSHDGSPVQLLNYLDDFVLDLEYEVAPDVGTYTVQVVFQDKDMRPAAQIQARGAGADFRAATGRQRLTVRIPRLPLATGAYGINVAFVGNSIDDPRGLTLGKFDNAAQIRMSGVPVVGHCPVLLQSEWQLETVKLSASSAATLEVPVGAS